MVTSLAHLAGTLDADRETGKGISTGVFSRVTSSPKHADIKLGELLQFGFETKSVIAFSVDCITPSLEGNGE